MRELEQLRSEYALLKKKLDTQDIVNDKLMRHTFKSNISEINKNVWVVVCCAAFVMLTAPFTFRNPPFEMSWSFIIATEILMAVCAFLTWKWHDDVKDPESSLSLREFAESVQLLKKRYEDWLKYSFVLVGLWVAWLLTELFTKSEDKTLTLVFAGGLMVGAIIGGIIGLSMHFKVVNGCKDILRQIDE